MVLFGAGIASKTSVGDAHAMHESPLPPDPELPGALARIPILAATDPTLLHVERLGGLTNRVYRVRAPGGEFALRIPGAGTASYIDRRVEAHNARLASRCGVSPELIHFDEADGLMLTRFRAETTTMSSNLFRTRPGSPARAARAFRKLHESAPEFQYRFELFAKIEEYRVYLDARGAEYPTDYFRVIEEAGLVRRRLSEVEIPLAPCHCDPLAENFLDDGEKMWIVDWEYSGMNDPLWDLGDLSVEAGFDEAQDEELLEAYCASEIHPSIRGRFHVYKAMCDLLWTLWGLIQHANQNPAEDFWLYATTRFARCRARMIEPEFQRRLSWIV